MEPDIRWMTRLDIDDVLRIEREAFVTPWTEDALALQTAKRNCTSLVAIVDGMVAGYLIFEQERKSLQLITIGVSHEMRRKGIGRILVDRMKQKISSDQAYRRDRIYLFVVETNLRAQQFFRSQGFYAVKLLRNYYLPKYPDLDAYKMIFEERSCINFRNRITQGANYA